MLAIDPKHPISPIHHWRGKKAPTRVLLWLSAAVASLCGWVEVGYPKSGTCQIYRRQGVWNRSTRHLHVIRNSTSASLPKHQLVSLSPPRSWIALPDYAGV